jgi:stress response protein YsnF
MFNTAGEAQRTLDDLIQLGFGPKDISVVTNLSMQRTLGGRANLAAIDAPDIGKIAASGPVADNLRQTSSSNGGLSGTLQYFGLSPKLADHYARGVQHGETLETLTVDDKDADRVVAVMERHARTEQDLAAKAAADASSASAAKQSKQEASAPMTPPMGQSGSTGPTPSEPTRSTDRSGNTAQARGQSFGTEDEERRIPIMREELRVGKREVERGGVHVSVHVKETPVSERVNLREQRVEIERRPVSRSPQAGEASFKSEEFDVKEYGEEAMVQKDVRVVEEVIVHKRTSDRDAVIADNLKSTEIDVSSKSGFDRGYYKKYFENANLQGSFDEYLPAYEAGHKLRGAKGNRWEDVEASARSTWEASRPGTWDRYKDSIKHAWTRARSS